MRPSSCSRVCSTSTARRARSASRAPRAERRRPRPARRRPAAAAALVDRGLRAQPQGPPGDRGAAVGEGGRSAPPSAAEAATPDQAELFTTAPDADDERGEWTAEELEAEEAAPDRGGHRGRGGRVAARRDGGGPLAPGAGAARPDAGDRREERGTCRTPRPGGSSTGSARTSARTCRPSGRRRRARRRSGTTAAS